MIKLDPFYPIFDSSSWLERLVPLGIKLVQLRIKDKDECELRVEIRAARKICSDYNCQLVINDYWELALDEGCDFIHLGQEDLDTADVTAIQNGGLKLGISSHDEAELDRALSVKPDYIALGPVFPTVLKKMKWHEQGLPRLAEWKSRIGTVPLVGIGGMSVERAPDVFAAGADIISAVTDITLHKNPEIRVTQWLEISRPFA